ncbi:MAG: sulfate reduction electron transfer complex DsrMKJOP subunit DsrJ [Desulfobacterales bacterium]
MNDRNKIIAGLIIFVAIITFPLWFNMGKAAPVPEPELTAKAKAAERCVEETDFMTAEHMTLLDLWRESVVREGRRLYTNSSGKSFDMSLSNTCLDCHSNKAEFCDRCHTYASADPYCWDCHIDNPKENE